MPDLTAMQYFEKWTEDNERALDIGLAKLTHDAFEEGRKYQLKFMESQAPTSSPDEPGWISVKDRMPEMIKAEDGHQYSTSKNVLWWDEVEGFFISCLNSNGSIYIDPGFNINPSHWMPLPQGPIKEPT